MLNLTEDLFYGKGTHKKCYLHPEDYSKCIKMAYTKPGEKDLKRELTYLKVLKRQGKDYSLLPKYYGSVITNLGTGHVYELIKDFDGTQSKTLEYYCENEHLLIQEFDMLVKKVNNLKNSLISNSIITMGLFPENIIVQRAGANDVQLRVINDIGSAALIPLEYYFDFIAKKRIKKRWERFISLMQNKYSSPIVRNFINMISKI